MGGCIDANDSCDDCNYLYVGNAMDWFLVIEKNIFINGLYGSRTTDGPRSHGRYVGCH